MAESAHMISEPSDKPSPAGEVSDESDMEHLCRGGRIGSIRIRRYKEKYWELDSSHPGGVHLPRLRRYRSSATAAVREARRMSQEIREHGVLARSLTNSQRWIAAECFKLMAQIGSGDPADLLYLVHEHRKKHPLGGNARSLDDVRKEVVARKAKLGRSERHVSGLDYKLRCLVKAIGNKPLTKITTADLEAELEEHPDWKATTVHSAVQSWKILFNFAVRKGYLVENPADRLDLPPIIHDEPTIFTVDEVKRLMAATLFADRDPLLPECRALLAIGLFAGLRPSEIERLDWCHVDLATATIRVKAANAKDRDRRIVEISPNLVAWLRPLAKPAGPVLEVPATKLRAAARSVLGLAEWPQDIMRHCFASYHFGQHQNEQFTKKQMGHRDDGRIFYNHYCVPVSRTSASLFFGIIPPVALLEFRFAA